MKEVNVNKKQCKPFFFLSSVLLNTCHPTLQRHFNQIKQWHWFKVFNIVNPINCSLTDPAEFATLG